MADESPTESWSVKKLKVYIRMRGGSTRGCVGKSDLVREAQQVQATTASFLSTSLSKEELFDRITAAVGIEESVQSEFDHSSCVGSTPVKTMVLTSDKCFWELHH